MEQQHLVETVDVVLCHHATMVFLVKPRERQWHLHGNHIKEADDHALREGAPKLAFETQCFLEAKMGGSIEIGGVGQAVFHAGVHVR
ncbi:MAG: hypothetical protein J5603_07725 [Bacteroidales bacterium]|nr:hypothetical protein [Bacteroidales bacterium]